MINGPAVYALAPQVLASVVRICTHHRIYARPSRVHDAFEFCRVLLEQPNATDRDYARFAGLAWRAPF